MIHNIIEEKDRYIFVTLSIIVLLGCTLYFSYYILIPSLIVLFTIYILIPRWVGQLAWVDINKSIKNQAVHGLDGSLLIFKIKKKRLYIYKDNDWQGLRMAVKVPLKDWEKIISRDELEKLLKVHGGWCGYSKTVREEFFFIFPDDPIQGSLNVLKYIINEKVGGLHPNIKARIDYAKRNYDIWQ